MVSPSTHRRAIRPMPERTVESRRPFVGRLLRLRVDEVELDDGRRTTREVVEHPGAVAMLPWDGEQLALVRQWRHAAGRALLEVPAGTLDPGEEPAATAARELAEEVDLRADTWERGPVFFTAPGFCTEYLTVYLATDLHPADESAHPDDEDLEVVRMTLADALTAVDHREIEDAKSIVAILWLARRLDGAAAIGPSKG
jgi:ADP-ribose pyrophosphatase